MKRKGGNTGHRTMLIGNLIGIAVTAAILILGVGFLSWVLLRESVAEKNVKWLLGVLLCVAVLLGAKAANVRFDGNKAINAGVQCALVMLMLLAIHIGFLGGPYVNAWLVAGSVVMGGMLSVLTEWMPRKRRKKRWNR